MIANDQVRQLLRDAALSAALLMMAAPAALADPQGYHAASEQPAYTAYVGLHPSAPDYALSPTSGGQIPGVSSRAADDQRATLWNENDFGAR